MSLMGAINARISQEMHKKIMLSTPVLQIYYFLIII